MRLFKSRYCIVVVILSALVLCFILVSLIYNLPLQNDYPVFLHIRFPRLLTAIGVAIILSLSGLFLQSLFSNDLAEPSILGISSSGTLGAVLSMTILEKLMLSGQWLLPTISILFSFISVKILLLVSRNGMSNTYILLFGVAVNSLCGALVTILTYLDPANNLKSIIFWGMGGFASTGIEVSTIIFTIGIVLLILSICFHKYLHILSLNEENLFYLGFDVNVIRPIVITLISLGVGVSVAFCGLVSFVGLICPHIARMLIGYQSKQLVWVTSLVSVLLVLVTDVICKFLFYPTELPTSVVTSILGFPIFVKLIFSVQKRTNANF